MPNENQISRNPAGTVGCRQSQLPQGDKCLLHSTHTYSRLLQPCVNTFTRPQSQSQSQSVSEGNWKCHCEWAGNQLWLYANLAHHAYAYALFPKYLQHFIIVNVLRAKLMAWLSVHANSCEQICIFHIYLPAACCHLRLKRQVSSGRGSW